MKRLKNIPRFGMTLRMLNGVEIEVEESRPGGATTFFFGGLMTSEEAAAADAADKAAKCQDEPPAPLTDDRPPPGSKDDEKPAIAIVWRGEWFGCSNATSAGRNSIASNGTRFVPRRTRLP